jgi:transcriptional regulator with XRE-family HTH domain
MFKTKARGLLTQYLKTNRVTQQALAEQLGTKQASVSSWALGKSRPEWHQRLALYCVAGIDPLAWATRDEEKLLARLGARVSVVVEKGAA